MPIPLVYDGHVEPFKGLNDSRFDYVRLESAEGLVWLETISSFRYESVRESFKPFTVRKETTRTGEYWYAYRKIGGRLHKKYVGKSSEMTSDKLEEIAEALNVPPELRAIDKVTEAAERGKRVTEKVTDGVPVEEFTALKSQVQALQESLEALREELRGKSELGNSNELPNELPMVTESELQITLGNLQTESEALRQELLDARTHYAKLLESSSHIKAEREKQIAELRSQLEIERADQEKLEAELADLKQKSAAAGKDLPDAAEVYNQFKAENPKAKTSYKEAGAILAIAQEMMEKS